MAEIFEVSNDCATAVEAVLAETKGYEVKYPKLKAALVCVGSVSAWYVIDSILCAVAPMPVKFPVKAAKLMRRIGIAAVGYAASAKVDDYLSESYDKSEKVLCDISEKIKTTMKEDESNEETVS